MPHGDIADQLGGQLEAIAAKVRATDCTPNDSAQIQAHLRALNSIISSTKANPSVAETDPEEFTRKVGCHPAVLNAMRRPLVRRVGSPSATQSPVASTDIIEAEGDVGEAATRQGSLKCEVRPALPLFPYAGLSMSIADNGSLATILERLFQALRTGVGSTVVVLSELMTHGTLQSVLDEASMAGVNCLPFAEVMLAELPTCITIQSVGETVRREGFLERVRLSKMEALRNRFPHLTDKEGVTTLNRLCDNEAVDFAVDRIPGILHTIQGRKPGGIRTLSSTGDAESKLLHPRSLGRALPHYTTNDWVEFSFSPWAAVISAYAFASAFPIGSGCPPRNWVLEGQYNGGPWTILSTHVDDNSISRTRNFAVFDIDASLRRHVVDTVRVRRTGPDSKGGHVLQVSGLELYGRYMIATPHQSPSIIAKATDFGSEPFKMEGRRALVHPSAAHLPPEPLPPKRKKAKK